MRLTKYAISKLENLCHWVGDIPHKLAIRHIARHTPIQYLILESPLPDIDPHKYLKFLSPQGVDAIIRASKVSQRIDHNIVVPKCITYKDGSQLTIQIKTLAERFQDELLIGAMPA